MKVVYNDVDIIDMIKSGDKIKEDRALGALYKDHCLDIERWLTRKGIPPAIDPKDIYQYAILALYYKVKSPEFKLTESASLKSLLYAICGNRWKNEWRTAKRQQNLKDKVELEEVDSDNMLQELITTERSDLLCQLVNDLGDRCKQLLQLFYFEKFRHDKIVEVMGFKNAQLSRNALFKCRKKLAAAIIANPVWTSTLINN